MKYTYTRKLGHLQWIHLLYSILPRFLFTHVLFLYRDGIACICPGLLTHFIAVTLTAKRLTPSFPLVMHLHNVLFVVCSKFNLLRLKPYTRLNDDKRRRRVRDWEKKNRPTIELRLCMHQELVIVCVRARVCLYVWIRRNVMVFQRIVKIKRAHICCKKIKILLEIEEKI